MPPRKGAFVVLEGPDKSGKSTQAALLARALRARGRKVVHTREPGGTRFAEALRKVLLDPEHDVHPIAELLLYEAARAQHTHELLKPALGRGEVVVCERFSLATLVYQGHARGLPLDVIRRLDRVATGGLAPDLTLILDVPDSAFTRRDPKRRPDRLERESRLFRLRVRDGYRALGRRQARTATLDGIRPQDVVHQDVLRRVLALLDGRGRR